MRKTKVIYVVNVHFNDEQTWLVDAFSNKKDAIKECNSSYQKEKKSLKDWHLRKNDIIYIDVDKNKVIYDEDGDVDDYVFDECIYSKKLTREDL